MTSLEQLSVAHMEVGYDCLIHFVWAYVDMLLNWSFKGYADGIYNG